VFSIYGNIVVYVVGTVSCDLGKAGILRNVKGGIRVTRFIARKVAYKRFINVFYKPVMATPNAAHISL
jgi:hypothetical protein